MALLVISLSVGVLRNLIQFDRSWLVETMLSFRHGGYFLNELYNEVRQRIIQSQGWL